ncbi:MAG: MBL fold metallo-hydrolase [bacterium]
MFINPKFKYPLSNRRSPFAVWRACPPANVISFRRAGRLENSRRLFIVSNRYAIRILLIPLILFSLSFQGCDSIAGRFFSRTVERFGEPTLAISHKNSNPILSNVELAVLWIGHSTMLIQIHDKIFLTDPVFTHTIGLISGRQVEPGLDPASLTKVDYVLISHLHFDHFNFGSLDMLPKQGCLVLPPGGAAYSPEFHFAETIELEQWKPYEADGVRITAVPVKHFSGRYGFDAWWSGDRGYTGYIIEYKGKTVFIGGDTAYNSTLFKTIGSRYTIDLACLPIAPIEPRQYMQRFHTDPNEAIRVMEDLGAKVMVPIHHRTLFLGLEAKETSAQELLQTLIQQKRYQKRIRILDIGEQIILE